MDVVSGIFHTNSSIYHDRDFIAINQRSSRINTKEDDKNKTAIIEISTENMKASPMRQNDSTDIIAIPSKAKKNLIPRILLGPFLDTLS